LNPSDPSVASRLSNMVVRSSSDSLRRSSEEACRSFSLSQPGGKEADVDIVDVHSKVAVGRGVKS